MSQALPFAGGATGNADSNVLVGRRGDGVDLRQPAFVAGGQVTKDPTGTKPMPTQGGVYAVQGKSAGSPIHRTEGR